MENYIDKGNQYIMKTYSRFPILFEKGEGVYLYDDKGKKYLDFVAGIAVNSLGYGHKKFIESLGNQLQKLNHVSNLYYTKPAIEVAEKLVKHTGFDQVFYCNSGAEAVEAALKLSRIYAQKHKGPECYEIITMNKSFHGRTMGALSLTGQDKYHQNLHPLLAGVKRANLNDVESVKNHISPNTAAIILEPIQGEGGINPSQKEFLENLRKICDEENIVLIFDEVQTGIGRTGTLFAFEQYGVVPDIVASAKGLGNGIPIGAILAKEKFAKDFTPGTHASTFGGNPIATTAAKVVLEELLDNGLLESIKEKGNYLIEKLEELKAKFNIIKEIRGIGLLQGIELDVEIAPIINACIKNGLLLVSSGSNVIRFIPPLIITKGQIDEAMKILEKALEDICNC